MNLLEQCRDRKIHDRKMDISTYDYDDAHIVVAGTLKDDILIPMYVSGEEQPPHTPHHMTIQIFIEAASLTVKNIHVEMTTVPYHWCKETADSLDPVKGLKIEPGFTSRVKKILREGKRCLHLTTLLFAMVPTVMQGYWTFNAGKPSAGDMPSGLIENYLLDTCWVWRKGGPRVTMLKRSQA